MDANVMVDNQNDVITKRIVAIQHGDYAEALRIIERGDPEPYFGMGYTLRVLNTLFEGNPHLVISLDAPALTKCSGNKGYLVGLPSPYFPRPIPGRITEFVWSYRILKEIKRFRPTHIVLRTAGRKAVAILKYCVHHELNTLAIFGNYFDNTNRITIQKLIPLLNHPCVALVGNHKQPATDSMVECGLNPSKAVAWDWPNTLHPRDYSEKKIELESEYLILYVGTISTLKGVGDLIETARLMTKSNMRIRFIAVGDGPEIQSLQAAASALTGGTFQFLGRRPNSEAFQLMRQASIVCVPSHHAFSEGMPLTLTEALASRTPTVISDHPVFLRVFRDGEGTRIVPEKNPNALAATLCQILSSPTEYAHLSRGTLEAYERVECKTLFGDLVNRWEKTF